MSSTPHEPDPPEPLLVARAGLAILGRVLERRELEREDWLRLAAFHRALGRLETALERRAL